MFYFILRPLQFLSGYQIGEFLLTHTLHGFLGYILERVSAQHCLGILTGGLLYRF